MGLRITRVVTSSLSGVGAKLIVEGFETDAEDPCCLFLVALTAIQGGENEPATRLSQREPNFESRLRGSCATRANLRETFDADVGFGDDECPLHDVFQLADVPGPRVSLQALDRSRGESFADMLALV